MVSLDGSTFKPTTLRFLQQWHDNLFIFLLISFSPVLSKKHSLYCIYTVLSRPPSLPGIYEFTAMGLLDDRQIDYYNSQDKVRVPRQDWMRESLTADFWEKGTQSRKSKEMWFKVNVNILMERMNHRYTDLHVLQWRHGCEAERHSDGSVRFVSGVSAYAYDGEDFLSFDLETMQWVAPVVQAVPTKRKWDDVPILNQYTKGYLEKECVDWLSKFVYYQEEEVKLHAPPNLYAFSRRATTPFKQNLTCMATGFYPKDVILIIRKYHNGLLKEVEGSAMVRPNGDGTYQIRKRVEISAHENAEYSCWMDHSTFRNPVTVVWDGTCHDCDTTVHGRLVSVIVIIIIVFMTIFLKIRKKRTTKTVHCSVAFTLTKGHL